MGIILDILKEIPLTAILRERLADQESKMAVLESENAVLKEKNAVLEAKNAALRRMLEDIKEKQSIQGDMCPYCRQPKGELLELAPHKLFWDSGIKTYKCAGCGKEYDKEHRPKSNFPS